MRNVYGRKNDRTFAIELVVASSCERADVVVRNWSWSSGQEREVQRRLPIEVLANRGHPPESTLIDLKHQKTYRTSSVRTLTPPIQATRMIPIPLTCPFIAGSPCPLNIRPASCSLHYTHATAAQLSSAGAALSCTCRVPMEPWAINEKPLDQL